MRDEGDQLESYHDETPLAASDDDTLLRSTSIDDPVDDDTPRQYPWMQRVSDNIPSPLKRISSAVVTWAKGPQPPRIYKIEPFFPSIQHAPLALLDRYAPKKMQRFWLLFVFYICWILSFALILHKSSFAADVQDYGSPQHGIDSIGFESYFPQSFQFVEGTQSQCKDLRWPLLAVSVFFTAMLSIFTTSPAVFFWSIFVGLFFQTGLASDPPNLTDYYSLISTALGRFLPAAFVMAIIYRYAVRYSLTGLTAQFEKTILWLGAAWVGALNNYTFDRIPIQRLTPHDIKAQPGAIPALISIVLIIFFIALGQAYAFRVEGRMPRYLVVYGLFVGGMLLLVAVPGMSLRIHHYILAILLLPGTSFQNRPSLLYQGLLCGLFINGIARWGFDSILQTPGELLSDAPQNTMLPPVLPPVVGANNITFTLGPVPPAHPKKNTPTYDGISILVNDVERFRGYADYDAEGLWESDGTRQWTWQRHDGELPEYFRFAYMAGNGVGDYTKAGSWLTNGTWISMKGGPS
ncbi:hypothetical protein D6D03_03266 [Aureobasidium pullulans]|nr:hypothetical protein D6D03_03266 [Aureobasidium pullulans]